MMTEHTRPTLTSPHMPIVLAIGCADALLTSVQAAGRAFSSIVGCDLASAHQHVAELRPWVLVVTASLFDFDPPKFSGLAEEGESALVVLEDDDAPVDQLEALLSGAITRMRTTRPPGRKGRYSVVTERELPPSSRRLTVP